MARRAGVPLSAVKYYQREGLLPEGVRSAPNQVAYGDEHVQRVRLIRALLETGGLSIAAAKEVIAAADSRETPLAEAFGVAQHAMAASRTTESAPSAATRDRILAAARARGWQMTVDNPGVDTAARAVDGLRTIGFDAPEGYLDAYAVAAETAAAADLRALTGRNSADGIAELMVVGSVLGDPLFAGLRRLAQQSATREFFPARKKEGEST
ncbi:MerR family transcriptional regulator [Microbacterium sp.]|uniref:MerR family transcriptional regulator n=1 Tax=Microbacterium sp. TaxID=51671 RepID=UPI003A866F53